MANRLGLYDYARIGLLLLVVGSIVEAAVMPGQFSFFSSAFSVAVVTVLFAYRAVRYNVPPREGGYALLGASLSIFIAPILFIMYHTERWTRDREEITADRNMKRSLLQIAAILVMVVFTATPLIMTGWVQQYKQNYVLDDTSDNVRATPYRSSTLNVTAPDGWSQDTFQDSQVMRNGIQYDIEKVYVDSDGSTMINLLQSRSKYTYNEVYGNETLYSRLTSSIRRQSGAVQAFRFDGRRILQYNRTVTRSGNEYQAATALFIGQRKAYYLSVISSGIEKSSYTTLFAYLSNYVSYSPM